MVKEETGQKCKCWGGGSGGAVYGLGFIGALFYFVPQAVGLQAILIAIFKSIFWPAFLVYRALGSLNV